MIEVVMPAGGMAMTEGTVVAWLKHEGERVEEGEPVVEVETDKSVVELESPAAGVLGPPLCKVGDVVPVGEPLVYVLDGAAAPTGNGSSPTRPAVSAPAPAPSLVVPAAVEVDDRLCLVQPGEKVYVPPADPDDLPDSALVEWLRTMALIRRFEEVSDAQSVKGKIPGGMHSAAGQEGVAVGVVRALAVTDIVASSHRSHHHALAKGLTARSIMAELFGKETGCLGGRGGHMHLADFSVGLYGSNGIVGGGLGIAMGAALGSKLRGAPQVCAAFFGDGGANTGRVWEFVNLASLWTLPLIIICENNLYAVETHIERAMAADSVAARAAGFGLPCVQVDGQDALAMYRATAEARARAAEAGGPTFIEALTYRYRGHNTSDPERYRDVAEVEEWRSRDPLARMRDELGRRGAMDDDAYQALLEEVAEEVDDSLAFAEESPWPDPATAADNVTGLGWDPRRPL